MECSQVREVLSAIVDGEASDSERDWAFAHTDSCDDCRSWFEVVADSARRWRVGPADVIPDMVPMVLSRVRTFHAGRWNWVRWALAVVAAVELASAVPSVFFGGAATGHDSRHVGSFGAALAVGLLFVAWRPIRAYGVLPITVALAVMMALAAVVDVTAARATAAGELHHAVEFAGLWLVWVLAGQPVPVRLQSLRGRRVAA